MKILIVDDNHSVRKMIKNLLSHIADEIFECNDGDQVVEQYALHIPDWVLMDVKMSRMDGIMATHELIKSFPDAKVIILTNFPTDDFREDAKKAGALEFMDKENLFSVGMIITNYPPRP